MPQSQPARNVLTGVPRVGFYPKQSTEGPEDHILPACLRAVLEYLKDDIHSDWLAPYAGDWHAVHEYLVGTCGFAFSLTWRTGAFGGPEPAWDVFSIAPDPLAAFRDALESVGYEHEIMLRRDLAQPLGLPESVCDDEATYRKRIIGSIDRGVPLIALGVVGPPEPCVIAGYDEGGDVLIGWSFFQDFDEHPPSDGFEPEGMFRQRDWFTNTKGLLVLGPKGRRPSNREACTEALIRGLELLRRTEVRGMAAAGVAYQAWASWLLDDGAFAGLSAQELELRRASHDGTAGHLAEGRCFGELLLRAAADALPEAADDLRQAMRCFEAIHDLVWRVWQTPGSGSNEEKALRLPQRAVREELNRLVRAMRDLDAEAASHIEAALRAAGVPDERVSAAPSEELEAVARSAAVRASRRADLSRVRHEGIKGTWVDGVSVPLDTSGRHLRHEELPADTTAPTRQRLITQIIQSVNLGLPALIGYGEGTATAIGYHIWSLHLYLLAENHPGPEPLRVSYDDPALHSPVVLLEG